MEHAKRFALSDHRYARRYRCACLEDVGFLHNLLIDLADRNLKAKSVTTTAQTGERLGGTTSPINPIPARREERRNCATIVHDMLPGHHGTTNALDREGLPTLFRPVAVEDADGSSPRPFHPRRMRATVTVRG